MFRDQSQSDSAPEASLDLSKTSTPRFPFGAGARRRVTPAVLLSRFSFDLRHAFITPKWLWAHFRKPRALFALGQSDSQVHVDVSRNIPRGQNVRGRVPANSPFTRFPNSIETSKALIPFLRPSEHTLLAQKHCPARSGSRCRKAR